MMFSAIGRGFAGGFGGPGALNFGQQDPALMLIREKFAKGELTEEEYLSRKALLTRK